MATPDSSSKTARTMFENLVHAARWRADRQGDELAYRFLLDGEEEESCITYAELDLRARTIASALQSRGTRPGERALLVYSPGLEFISALLGCLYADVVAVPVYPPDPFRLPRTLPRLETIVRDARASLVLSESSMYGLLDSLPSLAPALAKLDWILTDDLGPELADGWKDPNVTGENLAFIQYTSGSTSEPKGVMLGHRNLLHNNGVLLQRYSIGDASQMRLVSWLPPYHDMGLIGTILSGLQWGTPSTQMSPTDFLAKPIRWLRAMSRYRGVVSISPDFGFALSVRRTTEEERQGLDLSAWRVAICGSEPVRAQTVDDFVAAFGTHGFRREAFFPSYGLAEATLFVAGGPAGEGARCSTFDRASLEAGAPAEAGTQEAPLRQLMSCGRPADSFRLRIVDPITLETCPAGHVGEIWLSGESIARGYWPTGGVTGGDVWVQGEDERYFRTGDYGFLHDGHLYVTGRIKDVIIVNGRNLAAQDVEQSAERSHPALRPGCGAAFPLDIDGRERPVVVQEVRDTHLADAEAALAALAAAVESDLSVQLGAVVLVPKGTVPKTSSGKLQRRRCREQYLAGELEALAEWRIDQGRADREASRPTLVRPGSDRGLGEECDSLLAREARVLEPGAPRVEFLTSRLREMAAEVLRLPPDAIDVGVPLPDLGLESRLLAELSARLERELGIKLSSVLLFDHPSIDALVPELLRRIAGLDEALPPATEPRVQRDARAPTAPVSPIVQEVAELSDAEALRGLRESKTSRDRVRR